MTMPSFKTKPVEAPALNFNIPMTGRPFLARAVLESAGVAQAAGSEPSADGLDSMRSENRERAYRRGRRDSRGSPKR